MIRYGLSQYEVFVEIQQNRSLCKAYNESDTTFGLLHTSSDLSVFFDALNGIFHNYSRFILRIYIKKLQQLYPKSQGPMFKIRWGRQWLIFSSSIESSLGHHIQYAWKWSLNRNLRLYLYSGVFCRPFM